MSVGWVLEQWLLASLRLVSAQYMESTYWWDCLYQSYHSSSRKEK